ncbi:MAG: 3-hydroxyacyl-CoA dehydrogenase NAD-binding domain-containing protein [Paracoccaceae bacterium]
MAPSLLPIHKPGTSRTQWRLTPSDPSRVMGLHYFSPADINPLNELIVTSRSSESTMTRAQLPGRMIDCQSIG